MTPLNEDNYKLVLVNPEIQSDPDGRRNEIGIITSSDIAKDTFRVSFNNNTYSNFPADDLLLLKPVSEIQQLIINEGQYLSLPDLKALTQLQLMLQYGDGDMVYKALQMASDNPGIHEYCLDVLTNTLPVQKSLGPKR